MAGQRDASEYKVRDKIAIKRALLSVSDKTGIVDLAKALAKSGVEIVSTGSTAKLISESGIAVTEVSQVTGFPESLDGRVKTLHPMIHGGILADLRLSAHQDELEQLGIQPFELVVVNLYPFVETVASGARGDAVVEQIDIGGPAMVRAAAKNHANVAIVVEPENYAELISAIDAGGTTLALRKKFAQLAFAHTASYDSAVANWLASEYEIPQEDFPAQLSIRGQLVAPLRYGENSHQSAALYVNPLSSNGLASAQVLSGKEMSYNNYVDVDAALRAAYDFREPAVAIIKHANPCGIAIANAASDDPIASAHAKAHETDPVSAFGGVIAANREVTEKMALQVAEIFTEVIAAPGYSKSALEILQKKKNLRVVLLPSGYSRPRIEHKQISGGLLLQQSDGFENLDSSKWTLVSGESVDKETMRDLEFAWMACRAVKSNGILLAKNGAAVGVGMGQVNRLDSARLAVSRAGTRTDGSVAASDAFFPFADGLQILLEAGIKAVVQPGGSVRDEEVIAAAKAAGVTMYFTGERHFFH